MWQSIRSPKIRLQRYYKKTIYQSFAATKMAVKGCVYNDVAQRMV